MASPISPWKDSAECVSPDGRFRAVMAIAYEIRMGAPTAGDLIISDNSKPGRIVARLPSCNPSFVWSADSKALAVPQWTPELLQKLCIISVPEGRVQTMPQDFSVLELHSFEDGVVRGIDSPIHQPRKIQIAVPD